MAAKNRNDLKALITAWAATLNLETRHKPDEQEILDSVLLNRDVSNTIAVSGASTAVNFSGYDTIIVNTTQSTTLTISNLVDGEFKYLIINKALDNIVLFGNATDMSYNLLYGHVSLTLLVYKIVSKGSAGILAIPQHKTLDYSTLLTSTSILPGEWQEASLTSPWLANPNNSMRAGLWYRLDGTSYLDLEIAIFRSLAGAALITTLPNGYRPVRVQVCNPVTFVDDQVYGSIDINPNGQITFYSFSGTQYPVYVSLIAKINLT